MSEFECAVCKGTFVTDWTHDDAMAEFKRNWPNRSVAPEDIVSLCDECHKKHYAKLKKLERQRYVS